MALRGHSFSLPEQDCSVDPPLGGGSSGSSGPSVHQGPEQCPNRCPVVSQPSTGVQVDAQDGSLRGVSAALASHDGPICHFSQSPLLSLFLSLPRSPSSRHGCSASQLGSPPDLCSDVNVFFPEKNHQDKNRFFFLFLV